MSEVILMGEPMALFAANVPGRLEQAEVFTRYMSGAEVNVAIGLRRLEHSVLYATRLGKDPFGSYIEEKLQVEQIDTYIVKDDEHSTGIQFKNRVEVGDPEIFYYRKNSAASCMTIEDVDKIDFHDAKILHITGIFPALSENCKQAVEYAIQKARKEDMTVIFDPNLRPSLWKSQKEMVNTINTIAAKADIILPGTAEGKVLMGSDKPEEIAKFYRDLGVKTVIVKLGAKGAYAESLEGRAYYDGYKVEKIVDTVGAGDGFAVGIISGCLEGLSIEEMVDRGNKIGAIQVSVASDNEGLPTREELDMYRREN